MARSANSDNVGRGSLRLFKYFSAEQHAEALIAEGQVLLRTLAYFRAFEDANARGDPDDGVLSYRPDGGLEITKSNGERFRLNRSFRSSVAADQIFVYCLSSELSEGLSNKFNSSFCVEIPAAGLIGRIRRATRMRASLDNAVHFGPVRYRSMSQSPGIEWAFPEKIAFIKGEDWAHQKEHRVVVGKKGSLNIENVRLTLQEGKAPLEPTSDETLILKLGSFRRQATLHRFQ